MNNGMEEIWKGADLI